MSVLRLAPHIVFGSALAGFGLSFGRDVYRGFKKNWPTILTLFVLLSGFLGMYCAGLWFARNHRPWWLGIFYRLGTIALVYVCLIILAIIGSMADSIFEAGTPAILFSYAVALVTGQIGLGEFIEEATKGGGDIFLFFMLGGVVLVIIGLAVGFFQRRRRRKAWRADQHNEEFFAEHGLTTLREDRLRDDQDNGYELDDVFPEHGELEFKVLGRRGKRAYLEFDEEGKYTSWSGVVTQR